MVQGGYRQRTICDVLDKHQITWKVYYVPFALLFHVQHPHNLVRFQQFLSDAAAGTLPQVSFIDPAFSMAFGPETDEHAPQLPEATIDPARQEQCTGVAR